MSRLPIPRFIQEIKTKLGFDRTMTASGDDVVDAVNKQADEIMGLGSNISITGTINTTGSTIYVGTYFWLNGELCITLIDVDNGATFTLGTNYKKVTSGGFNELYIGDITNLCTIDSNYIQNAKVYRYGKLLLISAITQRNITETNMRIISFPYNCHYANAYVGAYGNNFIGEVVLGEGKNYILMNASSSSNNGMINLVALMM